MNTKKLTLIGLSLIFLLSLNLVSCTSEETKVTATATKTTVAPSDDQTLDQLLTNAKKERNVYLQSSFMRGDIDILRTGLSTKFSLWLGAPPIVSGSLTEAVAKMQTELQAGKSTSYDLVTSNPTQMLQLLRPAGLQSNIDWEPLLAEMGIDAGLYKVAPDPVNSLIMYGSVNAWVYNTDLMSEEDLPKNLADLTDPKYNGRFGWNNSSGPNVSIAYILGKSQDEAVQWIQDLKANGALFAKPEEVALSVSLGEIEFGYIDSKEYTKLIKADPDVPLGIALPQDLIYVNESFWSVIEGCEHPNVAKLSILWILTEDGNKWMLDGSGLQNYRDPSTVEYELLQGAKDEGLIITYESGATDYLNWLSTDDATAYTAAIDAAIKGE